MTTRNHRRGARALLGAFTAYALGMMLLGALFAGLGEGIWSRLSEDARGMALVIAHGGALLMWCLILGSLLGLSVWLGRWSATPAPHGRERNQSTLHTRGRRRY
jgi:hypothetical protein